MLRFTGVRNVYTHFISPIHGSQNTQTHTQSTYTRTQAHKYI